MSDAKGCPINFEGFEGRFSRIRFLGDVGPDSLLPWVLSVEEDGALNWAGDILDTSTPEVLLLDKDRASDFESAVELIRTSAETNRSNQTIEIHDGASMSSLSSQLSGSDVGDPITLEDLCSSLDEGWSEAPKPAASSAIPHAGGPPESFSVPSLLGKRSRSQSPEAEYVHDLAVHATVSTEEDFLSTYGPSRFGGWGEYMRRKRAKLQNQNAVMQEASLYKAQLFGGIRVYVRS